MQNSRVFTANAEKGVKVRYLLFCILMMSFCCSRSLPVTTTANDDRGLCKRRRKYSQENKGYKKTRTKIEVNIEQNFIRAFFVAYYGLCHFRFHRGMEEAGKSSIFLEKTHIGQCCSLLKFDNLGPRIMDYLEHSLNHVCSRYGPIIKEERYTTHRKRD